MERGSAWKLLSDDPPEWVKVRGRCDRCLIEWRLPLEDVIARMAAHEEASPACKGHLVLPDVAAVDVSGEPGAEIAARLKGWLASR
jgi:hypothetical protein